MNDLRHDTIVRMRSSKRRMGSVVSAATALVLFIHGGLAAIAADSTAAPNRPLPPAEAPRHMTVPEGFKVSLFAGEPDVEQPIGFTTDDRGRPWVGECF